MMSQYLMLDEAVTSLPGLVSNPIARRVLLRDRRLGWNWSVRLRITDVRDHSVHELDLPLDSRDMVGWQQGSLGWSIGRKGSGAAIELDEQLGDCSVGVFTASFQVLLWGTAKELPDVWVFPQSRSVGALVPFDPGRWFLIERQELGRVAMGGNVKLRFDQSPIRFGNFILENLSATESARESCAFCGAVLQLYFRVGSQQACPACTENVRSEMRSSRIRYYRLAVRDGIIAAIAGGFVHSLFLSAIHVTFGPILIGVLVGVAMRRASRESADAYFRLTAVLLTLGAALVPWNLRFVGVESSATFMFATSVAIGMLAAWAIASRNVETEIEGPYQSKTAS